tara:strand:+ start:3375 stop:4832 length:1458 start_codon:yes stop_codon:yes gene_type:complete
MEVADPVQEQVDIQAPPGVQMVSAADLGKPLIDQVQEQASQEEPEQQQEETPPEEPKEEIKDAASSLMERLGYKKPSEEPPAEPEPEPEPVEEKVEEEPVAEEKPKRKRGRPRKDESITANEIKDIIRETASSVAAANSPKDTPQQVTSYDEIEALNKDDLEIFASLEEKDPKYAGIRDKYKKYLGSLSGYKEAWAKDNPGLTFNPNDAEHEDWVNSNMPEFDDRDFDDARIETRAKRLIKDQEQKYMSELDSVRSEVAEANMKTELQDGANNSIAEVVSNIDESYLKMIQENGGEALEEADPIAHHVLNDTLSRSENMLYELEKLSHPSRKFKLNAANETHKELLQFAMGKEKEIAALSPSDQIHEGKRFATTEQYAKMSDAQRQNHWRLEPSHIKTMYVSQISQEAKNRIQSERERFERYISKKSSGTKNSQGGSVKNIISPAKRTKPQPPATSGEAVSSTSTGDPGKNNLGDLPTLKKFLWG